MPFYQNVFNSEFKGVFLTSDLNSYSLTFSVPQNINTGNLSVAFNPEPYDFSVTTDTNLSIRFNPNLNALKNFALLDVDLNGLTTATQVVDALNANTTFVTHFTASVKNLNDLNTSKTVLIRTKKDNNFRYYFENIGAEEALRFNKNAGIAEMPSYFDRHLVENAYVFEDSIWSLLKLDPATSELDLIREHLKDNTWTSADLLDDWELLKGRVNTFHFERNIYNGSNQLVEKYRWTAGAKVGDLGIRSTYKYSGSNLTEFTEEPYILTSTDIAVVPV